MVIAPTDIRGMSQSLLAGVSRPSEPSADEIQLLDDDTAIQDVLDVFDDSDCREILDATSEEALSAGEIAERCGLPTSTTYRKLEEMTEVGVLDERVRFRCPGRSPSEYALSVDNLLITVGDEGGLQLALTRRDNEPAIPEFRGAGSD